MVGVTCVASMGGILLLLVLVLLASAHVCLLSGLGADASESAESGTSLVGVVGVRMRIIEIISISYRSSSLINVLVWIQVIGVWRSMNDVIVRHSDIGLSKLVQNRPRSLRVDC